MGGNAELAGRPREQGLGLVKIFATIGLALGVNACASYQGISEFEAYHRGYQQTNDISQSILDQLAVAERTVFFRTTAAQNRYFNPSHAAYYTDSTDPPGTAAFRRALAAVNTYNELLYGLASGETAEVLSNKLNRYVAEVAAAVGQAGAIAGGAPGADDLVQPAGTVASAFGAVTPVVTVAFGYAARDRFREFLVHDRDKVRDVLIAVRNATPAIYNVLTSAASNPRSRFTGTPDPEGDKKRTLYRKLLSDWVLLLDANIAALDDAVEAATATPTLDASMAALARSATEIGGAVKDARVSLAKLSQ
jgi:hypothetical protein